MQIRTLGNSGFSSTGNRRWIRFVIWDTNFAKPLGFEPGPADLFRSIVPVGSG